MQKDDEIFYKAYEPISKRYEKDVDHFYLDSVGALTIGRGHLVAKRTDTGSYVWEAGNKDKTLAPLKPYLYLRDKNFIANDKEVDIDIQEVINTVHVKFMGYSEGYYNSPTRLKFIGIEQIWQQDVSKKLHYLRMNNCFFNNPNVPFEAKLVLLDIAFQSGEHYLSDNPLKSIKRKSIYVLYFAPMRTAMLNNDLEGLFNKVQIFDHYLLKIKSIGNDRVNWRRNTLRKAINHPTFFNLRKSNDYSNNVIPFINRTTNFSIDTTLLGFFGNINTRIATIPFEPLNITPKQSTLTLLKLQTPLPDPLITTQLTGHEALSQPYQLQVTAYAQNTAIQAKQLLMKPVSVKLHNTTGNLQRYFHGIVNRLVAGKIQDGWRQYTLEIVPAISLLNWEMDCRIFRNMSVLEIIRKILNTHHIQMDSQQIKRILPKRDYCVQYQESTLNFIQRLLEQEGIYYYFIHQENNHVLTLGDHNQGYYYNNKPVLQYTGQGDTSASGELQYWEKQADYYAGEFVHGDYDFTKPHTKLVAQQSQPAKLKAASKAHWYEHPGYFADQAAGKTLAQLRADALEAWHEWIDAASETPLMPGQVFNVSTHADAQQQGDYVVASAYHYIHDATHSKNSAPDRSHHYQCVFKALPANLTARPQCNAARPKIHGYQTALVVGDGQEGQEAHVDHYGRVCVRFHWEREQKSSCWVRVAQRWAGKQWGMVFHPRLGQEVIVTFEHGDPDRPLIIGSAYNANHMPTYELPAHHTRSGIKTRSTKKGAPAQANELYFEDQQGAENIYWHAQKDFTRVVEHNEQVIIQHGNQHTKVMSGKSSWEAAKAIALKVGSNTVQITLVGIFINGQQIKFAKT